ncbi:MAG TPA: GTPase HflX [Ignavibacteria bacterium]|nr:GTPase HflX [Ignavibacteria bacterium]HAX47709.1 GTPase HflX [Bacteroidota bacterium]HRE09969.1 GTPase HflX [Ignavibacteria bacterium]HRF66963.1 GTPase HflX [Ignavibacteria bacterium]HRJ05641.1 GTPase HflX [Ignavibacteria bacterium]
MSKLHTTKKEEEKAILVCTTIPKSTTAKTVKQKIFKEHLEELEFLTQTAGAAVVDKVYQERDKIDKSLFIGKGKAQEIAKKVEDEKIDLVIFENSLSPTQIRNLEKIIKCKVIDKPALILDIFASNAKTSEAKTQVELAQLQYLQARLTRAWTHLSKQYGGIGTKGPGETQIETDRRLIGTRIAMLKEKLKKIEEQRKTQRQQRGGFSRIALVGYTNVGKSTLLNLLTNAGVYVENKLFATLDTSTKVLKEINGEKLPQPVLISDTVGFIRNLPHDLIESFKSTLAEVVEADILLHVIDLSSDSYEDQITVVEETLKDLGADSKQVIMVFNKVDKLGENKQELITALKQRYPDSVFISAFKGINMGSLFDKIIDMMRSEIEEVEIKIPANDPEAYKVINMLHEEADIVSTKYLQKFIKLKIRGNSKHLTKILSGLGSQKQPPRGKLKKNRKELSAEAV